MIIIATTRAFCSHVPRRDVVHIAMDGRIVKTGGPDLSGARPNAGGLRHDSRRGRRWRRWRHRLYRSRCRATNAAPTIDIPAGLQSDEPDRHRLRRCRPEPGRAHVRYRRRRRARNDRRAPVPRDADRRRSPWSTTVDRQNVAENADLTYTVLQNVGTAVRVDGKRASHVGAGARMIWNVALLGGASVTDQVISEHAGEGANSEIAALFFPVAREVVQLTTEVQHNVPHTSSQTVVRSIAAGRGRGRYFGNIRIAPHAHGSEASLRDDTLLIGKDAKIDAIPALEIAANDVKAFHGATCRRDRRGAHLLPDEPRPRTRRGREADRARLFPNPPSRAFPGRGVCGPWYNCARCSKKSWQEPGDDRFGRRARGRDRG